MPKLIPFRAGRCAALLGLLLLGACSGVVAAPDPLTLPRTASVYVVARDWHAEIGVRAEDLDGPLAELRARFPGAATLLFGFGDRQYLVNRQPGFGDMLLAALPGKGALLVTALRTTPEDAFGRDSAVTVGLSQPGLARALDFLWSSFETAPDGTPRLLGEGPYPGSLFYGSSVTYALTHTCNTWTAEVLQTGGAAVQAQGVLLAGQVMARARAVARPPLQAAAD